MNSLRAPTLGDTVLLLIVGAIWGSSFMLIAIALEGLSPGAIASWRIVFGTLLVLAVLTLQGRRLPRDRRSMILFLCIGLLNSAIPFTLIAWGQRSVDSATTGILMATSPFVSLIATRWLAPDDPVTRWRVLGLLFGFAGVVVLFIRELDGGSPIAMLSIMIAAACYALAALLIRHLGSMPALEVAGGSLLGSALVMLPMLLLWYPPWALSLETRPLLAMCLLVIGPTAMGYVLRAMIVQRNGALFMSNVGYLIPLFAVLWAWLFLNELPTPETWLALALILIGILLGRRR